MDKPLKAYKMNTLELARHHREYCEGEECNISLTVLRMMAEEVGIEFTKEEAEVFV